MQVRKRVTGWRYKPGLYEGLYEQAWAWEHDSGEVTLKVFEDEETGRWHVETVSDDYNEPRRVINPATNKTDALGAAYEFMERNPDGGKYRRRPPTGPGVPPDFDFSQERGDR